MEWQTPVDGLAVFADGGVGENGYAHLLGGVRVYFGGSKPLKERHRQDDPSNINTTFIGTTSGGSTNTDEAPADSGEGGTGGMGGCSCPG